MAGLYFLETRKRVMTKNGGNTRRSAHFCSFPRAGRQDAPHPPHARTTLHTLFERQRLIRRADRRGTSSPPERRALRAGNWHCRKMPHNTRRLGAGTRCFRPRTCVAEKQRARGDSRWLSVAQPTVRRMPPAKRVAASGLHTTHAHYIVRILPVWQGCLPLSNPWSHTTTHACFPMPRRVPSVHVPHCIAVNVNQL